MMAGVLEVYPHARGAWLVRSGRFRAAVPPVVGQALLPLAGGRPSATRVAACLANTDDPVCDAREAAALAHRLTVGAADRPRRAPGRPVWLRVPLVPERVMRAAADRLAPWTAWPVLAMMAAIGAAGYVVLLCHGPGGSPSPGSLLPAAGLLLLTVLWHEAGHAAALARGGYPPGGVGFGLLFVVPVLWADVSAVAALGRSDRLRVDLAGLVFQLAAGGGLATTAAIGGFASGVPAMAAWSVLLAAGWSLLPFIRSDGYWILCDGLGVDSLERRVPSTFGPVRRILLVTYRIANLLFLAALAVLLPLRLGTILLRLAVFLGVPVARTGWRIAVGVLVAGTVCAIWTGTIRRARILVGPPA